MFSETQWMYSFSALRSFALVSVLPSQNSAYQVCSNGYLPMHSFQSEIFPRNAEYIPECFYTIYYLFGPIPLLDSLFNVILGDSDFIHLSDFCSNFFSTASIQDWVVVLALFSHIPPLKSGKASVEIVRSVCLVCLIEFSFPLLKIKSNENNYY